MFLIQICFFQPGKTLSGEERIENTKTKKKKIKITESDENNDLKIPKPILLKIITELPINEMMNVLVSCKLFYFLMNTEPFWKILAHKRMAEEDIDFLIKQEKTWKEIFMESLSVWDAEKSHQSIIIKGKTIIHAPKQGLATAFTKREFQTGTINILFVFKLRANDTSLCGAGIGLTTR